MKNLQFEVANRNDFIMKTREAHIDIEVYYLRKGERLYFVENKTYDLKEGSIIFINSNCIHKTQKVNETGHERLLLEIHPDFFEPFLKCFPNIRFDLLFSMSSIVCTPTVPQNLEIQQYFQKIEMLYTSRPPAFEEEIRCLVYMICLSFQRIASLNMEENIISDTKHMRIREIIDYLNQHMGEIQTLDDLCESLFMSKSYLCHMFKEATGLSVIGYLQTIRVRRAKVYLQEENDSILKISQKLGFSNPVRFSQLFKRMEGISPSEYRHLYKNE